MGASPYTKKLQFTILSEPPEDLHNHDIHHFEELLTGSFLDRFMRSKISKFLSSQTTRDILSMPKREIANDGQASGSKVAKQSENGSAKSKVYIYDGLILKSEMEVRKRDSFTEPLPKRDADGVLLFSDAKEFRPNMTPKEIL